MQVTTRLKPGKMWDHVGTYMGGIGFKYRGHVVVCEVSDGGELACAPPRPSHAGGQPCDLPHAWMLANSAPEWATSQVPGSLPAWAAITWQVLAGPLLGTGRRQALEITTRSAAALDVTVLWTLRGP